MKKRVFFSSIVGLCIFLFTFIATEVTILAQEADFVAPKEPQFVPGEVIVKYREGVSTAAISTLSERLHLATVETYEFVGVQHAKIPETQTILGMIAELSKMPDVEYAEPNYYLYALETPNDTNYPQQWGYKNIQAETAWDTAKDSSDVVVAVIDTGVDYNHPDLRGNMWKNPGEIPGNKLDDDKNGIVDDIYGANFVPITATEDPMDDNLHGTHVAGIIAAMTNNSAGVAGTTWKTNIMALKFLSASGSGSTANAIRAIEYAIKKGAHIMSNSWGGGGSSQALEEAINEANKQGILFVAAAGNSNTDNDKAPHYPSNYNVENILAIMSTDSEDKKSSFSCYGRTSVDLAAPGTGILSTVPQGGYRSLSGTSMATPFVSGAAALLKGQNPLWKTAELKAHLMATVDKLASLKGLCVTEGRLNLAKAIGPIKPPVCEDGPSLLACDEFFWPDRKQFSQNSNVLSVTFTIPRDMYIDVSADASARIVQGSAPQSFTTGLYLGSTPDAMYSGSYRMGSFVSANDISPVHTSFCIKLNKGTYTFYWKLWLSGYTAQFDSAVLAVRAFPCTMGGKLIAAVGAEDAEVTIFKETESVSPRKVDLSEMDMGITKWELK